jgi:hypothetical protein
LYLGGGFVIASHKLRIDIAKVQFIGLRQIKRLDRSGGHQGADCRVL